MYASLHAPERLLDAKAKGP